MRYLLFALVALCVASMAMAQPAGLRTDHPKFTTWAELDTLRSEAGIIPDDATANWNTKSTDWATIVSQYRALPYTGDVSGYFDGSAAEAEAGSLNRNFRVTMTVAAVTDSVAGETALHDSASVKLKRMMDSFNDLVSARYSGSAGTYVGGTSSAAGTSEWCEDGAYDGLLRSWSWMHRDMAGSGDATATGSPDSTVHSLFGEILYETQRQTDTSYLSGGDGRGKYGYDVAMRRNGTVAMMLAFSGSTVAESWASWATGGNARLDSLLYPTFLNMQRSRVAVNHGCYYAYEDGSSRAVEDIQAVLWYSNALPDTTHLFTQYSKHYLNFHDWTVNRVWSNLENVDVRGDEIRVPVASNSVFAAYATATHDGDGAALDLLDDITAAMGSADDTYWRFWYDDQTITPRDGSAFPLGKNFGDDLIAWGSEDDNLTGKGGYAYWRSRFEFDSQVDDPTPIENVVAFGVAAGPQTGIGHDWIMSGRGHFWFHRGDDWGTGLPGFYDGSQSSFFHMFRHTSGHNTVRIVNSADPLWDDTSSTPYDATQWSGASSIESPMLGFAASIGSQRWYDYSSRTGGSSPGIPSGGISDPWQTFELDKFKNGYVYRYSLLDKGAGITIDNTWDYPNESTSSLWADPSIDSHFRKVIIFGDRSDDGRAVVMKAELADPSQSGLTYVEHVWLPDSLWADYTALGSGTPAWDGAGTVNGAGGTAGKSGGATVDGLRYDAGDSRFTFRAVSEDTVTVTMIGGPNSAGDYFAGVSWFDEPDDGDGRNLAGATSYEWSDPTRGTWRATDDGGVYPVDPSFEHYIGGVNFLGYDNGRSGEYDLAGGDSWGPDGKPCFYRAEWSMNSYSTDPFAWVLVMEATDAASLDTLDVAALVSVDSAHYGAEATLGDTLAVGIFDRDLTPTDNVSFTTATTASPVRVVGEGMTPSTTMQITMPDAGTSNVATDDRGFLEFINDEGGAFSIAPLAGGDTNPPTVPSITAIVAEGENLRVYWSASTDAEGSTPITYTLEHNNNVEWVAVGTTESLTMTDGPYPDGSTEDYRVYASDSQGNDSEPSASQTGTANDTVGPTAPAGLAIDSDTDSSISLSWSAATDVSGISGYTLRWKKTSDSVWTVGSLIGTLSATVTGLLENTSYDFAVSATDNASPANQGSYSATVAGSTDGPPTPNPMTWSSDPAAVDETSITMTATTATDADGGIEYQFTEYTGNPGGTTSGWQASPTYVDTGLTEGTSYSYSVSARDAGGYETDESVVRAATTDEAAAASTPSDPGAFVFQSAYMGEAPDSASLWVYLGTELKSYWPNDSLTSLGNVRLRAATLDTIGHWRGIFHYFYPGGDSVLAPGGTFTQVAYTPEEIDLVLAASHGSGSWADVSSAAVLANLQALLAGTYEIGNQVSSVKLTGQSTYVLADALPTLDEIVAGVPTAVAIASAVQDSVPTDASIYTYAAGQQPGTWSAVNSAAEISDALADEFAAVPFSTASAVDDTLAAAFAGVGVLSGAGSKALQITIRDTDTGVGVPNARHRFYTDSGYTSLHDSNPLNASGVVTILVDPATTYYGVAKKSGYSTRTYQVTTTSGTTTQLYDVIGGMAKLPLADAEDPDKCMMRWQALDSSGNPVSGVIGTVEWNRRSGGVTAGDAQLTQTIVDTTDVNGLIQIELIRSSEVVPVGLTTKWTFNDRRFQTLNSVTVPDSTSAWVVHNKN